MSVNAAVLVRPCPSLNSRNYLNRGVKLQCIPIFGCICLHEFKAVAFGPVALQVMVVVMKQYYISCCGWGDKGEWITDIPMPGIGIDDDCAFLYLVDGVHSSM